MGGAEQFSTVSTVLYAFCANLQSGNATDACVFRFSVGCDIDQIDAGPGGVTMEQFQRIYVQQR